MTEVDKYIIQALDDMDPDRFVDPDGVMPIARVMLKGAGTPKEMEEVIDLVSGSGLIDLYDDWYDATKSIRKAIEVMDDAEAEELVRQGYTLKPRDYCVGPGPQLISPEGDPVCVSAGVYCSVVRIGDRKKR